MTVPAARAEEGRAAMLELFPEGFEEVERAHQLELAAYTDADGATRLWRMFGEYSSSTVADDWADRWRCFHRPVSVGDLWVGPPWHEPPPGALAVVIDPGRAFGTGAHATTRLCLELLAMLERGSLLDAGSGSGVLAIAAARLGFRPVYAVDHDEAALEATARNAEANGVVVDTQIADLLSDPLPAATAVVANLSLATASALAARVEATALLTSGYLAGERPDVTGFAHRLRRECAGWAADLWERAS